MPEMTFRVRWPDGSEADCYSPSLVMHDHLAAGSEYPLDDFVRRSTEALRVANAGRATAPSDLVGRDADGPFGVFGPEGVLALMELRGETLRSLIVFAPSNLRPKEPARIDP